MKPALAAFDLNNIDLGNGTKIGDTYSSTGTLISIILKNSLVIASILLLGLLIFGGVSFIISAGSGDSKKSEQGKKAITNAAIGFAIVFLAYAIIQVIETFTGLNILKPNL